MMRTLERERVNRLHIVILAVVCFVAFFVNNRVFYTDIMESRNIITAREMVYDGHWMVPTMNGELRLEKPPLPTWAAAGVEMLLPDSIVAQRAVAGIMAVVLVVFFYLLSLRMTRDSDYALIASLVLCTSYNIILMGRTASWDIWCHAMMMGAIYYMYCAFENPGRQIGRFMAAGVMLGLSFMSKGPVSFYALLLPFLVAYFLVFHRFSRNKWAGIVMMILTFAVVGFWWYGVIYEFHREEAMYVLEKESAAWSNHHVRPWHYYSTFFGETGVWALMLLTSLVFPYWLRRLTMRREYLFALSWTLLIVFFLSLMPEKKNRYLLPMLIPAAMTVAHLLRWWIERFARHEDDRSDRWFFGINVWLLALVVLALPVLAYLFLYAKGSISLVNLATVSAAMLAVGVWLVVAAVRRKPAAMLWAVVVLFAVAEILAMPYIGKLANNSGYHSIHATRNIPELEGLEFFHPDSEELRIDVVYEAGRKILPVDLTDSTAVVEALPFVLVSQHRAEELLPATLLPHLDLRFIDRYDDNRQQPSDKHYTPVFINNVTLIQAAPEPVPSVVADSVGMGLVASASGLTACVTE